AQVRALLADLRQFDTAVNTLNSKYNGLPGDCNRAFEFGIDRPIGSSTPNVAETTDTSGNHNGNGDSLLQDGADTFVTFSGEIMNFWVHLANQNLIGEGIAGQAGCTAAGGASPCRNTA